MLNLAVLTPPITPAAAGGSVLPAAAPPPQAPASRAFQTELQRAQHHAGPAARDEPPRPRPPEARREAQAASPAARETPARPGPQRPAREGTDAAPSGDAASKAPRPATTRASRHPDSTDASRAGARGDSRSRASARPGATEGSSEALPRQPKARVAGEEATTLPDPTTAAGLAAALALEPRAVLPAGMALPVDRAADTVAADGADTLAAVDTLPTGDASTAFDATGVTAGLAAAKPDGPTIASAGAGTDRTATAEATTTLDTTAPAGWAPVHGQAMDRLADTITRLGSEVRARAAREPDHAAPLSAPATTAWPAEDRRATPPQGAPIAALAGAAPDDSLATGRPGRLRPMAAAGRDGDVGVGMTTERAGTRERFADAGAAATAPASLRPGEASAARSADAREPATDARGSTDGFATAAAPERPAATPSAATDALASRIPVAARAATALDAASTALARPAATVASGRSPLPALNDTPASALAPTGPVVALDPRADVTAPAAAAVSAAATAADMPVAGTRAPSAPLAVAIGEPALRALPGALPAARRTDNAADPGPAATALPAALAPTRASPLEELSSPPRETRARETDIPAASALPAGDPLPRPAVPLAPVAAVTPAPADGSMAVAAAGMVEARPADASSGMAPAADAAAAALATATIDAPVDSPAFAPALGARIALFARDGIEQARLNVHPAELGPISVQLSVDGAKVRVDMTADVGTTRQALEQSLPSLASSLRDAGFTLTGGGVFQQWGQGQREGGSAGPSSRATGSTDDADEDAVSMTVSAAPLRRAAGLVDVFA